MQEKSLASLEELPEFQSNPFDGRTDVPVHEIARLTYFRSPDTQYQRQETVSVVGRSNDANTIYFARESMKMANDSIMAIHSNIGYADREHIIGYEIVIPNSKLAKSTSQVRELR